MPLVAIHDKTEIEMYARRNPLLHLFELGDLDDYYWPHTVWYALKEADTMRQLALLYTALTTPVLLANPDPPLDLMRELLHALIPLLPRRVYAHIHPALVDFVRRDYAVHSHGIHYRMGLRDRSGVISVDTSAVTVLSEADLPALEALYRESYPGTWVTAQMLQTGCYYGIRESSAIVSVAGVHIYAPGYKVAALGNVTTHPRMRGRGLARAVCARLCQALLQDGVEQIGLNVKADNQSAIACYSGLGFEQVAEFGAYSLEWGV